MTEHGLLIGGSGPGATEPPRQPTTLTLRNPQGAGLVPQTRSSHHIAASAIANFGFKAALES